MDTKALCSFLMPVAQLFMIGALTLIAAIQAFAGIAQKSAPALVPQFAPWRGTAPSLQADQIAANTGIKTDQDEARRLAISALHGQALNARAVRLLGMLADAAHQPSRANALINLSTRISRRDFGAQFWLINHEAIGNNIDATLQHYDIALRTTSDASKMLYPVLTSALDDKDVDLAFVPYIKADPSWLAGFLEHAITQTKHPESFAYLIVRAGGIPNTPEHQGQTSQLISRLISMNHYDLAKQTFLRLYPRDSAVLTSAGFERSSTDRGLAAIGWQLTSAPTVGASITNITGGTSYALDIFSSAGERQRVARKLLFLTPGSYSVSIVYDDLHLGHGGSILWELQCVNSNSIERIWRNEINGPTGKLRSQPMGISIPQACIAQYVDLTIAGGSDQIGSNVRVANISVNKH